MRRGRPRKEAPRRRADAPPYRSNRPDWKLKMTSKDPSVTTYSDVGAGWTNSKGGISIKLDAGVVLNWRDYEDYYLTLWPQDDDKIPF